MLFIHLLALFPAINISFTKLGKHAQEKVVASVAPSAMESARLWVRGNVILSCSAFCDCHFFHPVGGECSEDDDCDPTSAPGGCDVRDDICVIEGSEKISTLNINNLCVFNIFIFR